MNCIVKGCKCTASISVKTLWGKEETIFFCDNHTPEWAKNKKIGELSPKTVMFGISKNWYEINGLFN